MTAALSPHFAEVHAADNHPALIDMWRALQRGWAPPETISEEQYASLREAARAGRHSPLIAAVGFGASFGGKWFAGYARADSRSRNYMAECVRGLAKKAPAIGGVEYECADYRAVEVRHGDVVYLDPPYAGTTGYHTTFDSSEFWRVARAWSEYADVFVSEYQAPPGWVPIWSHEYTRSLKGDFKNAARVTDRLFAWGF